MVNYGNSKIYKVEPIVDHEEGEIYIGSTTKKYLSQRMDSHRKNYKGWNEGKYHNITIFTLFDKYGVENCRIHLLESINANSKDELTAREGYYIKKLKCVNKRIEGRTDKQYREDNKEKIAEYQNKYRVDNKIQLLEFQKSVCVCEICGRTYTKRHKAKHQKTKVCMESIIPKPF